MTLRLFASIAAAVVAATMLFAAPAPSAASGPTIVQCYGASTFSNLCGTAPPSPLQQHVPDGVTVVNYAVGSHRSYAIATKMGVYQLTTGRSIIIPADGAIEIGTPGDLPVPLERFDRLTMRSTIAGIEGILLRGDGAQWRFTRIQPGDAQSVPAGTPIVSLETPQPGSVSIINPGLNNMVEVDRVLHDLELMVAAHRAASDAPYWIATLPPAWGGFDTQYGAARLAINDAIRTTYGDHVAPYGEYLLNGALADAGIVPTAADRQRIAAGITPESLQLSARDWTHHNMAGRQIGARFLAGFISGAMTTERAYERFDAAVELSTDVRHDSIVVSGSAFDGSDVYQTIPVEISVDGTHEATVNATGPSPSLEPFGVPGAHGFSWTTTVPDGTHRVCVTAIDFSAGDDSDPRCAVVTVDRMAAPDRIAGDDRYETAALLSSEHYADGAVEVYVASGQVFADAPSAAAAAAHVRAPLLLTQRNALPAATRAELRRLDPDSIVLVGGTPTVSSEVEAALSQIATVTRIAGADRYETSALIAEHAFSAATQAMVATGRNFADALAAGPVAALRDAPVLLVDGHREGAASTLTALGSLGVQHITTVGGAPSVSDATVASLSQGRTTDRIAGSNRYETAVLLSHAFADPVTDAYVAAGAMFPDALASSAVAGAAGIPLLLTPGSCMYGAVVDEIERLGQPSVTLIGGKPTLSEAVARYQTC